MNQTIIAAFACDAGEKALFTRYAAQYGARVTLFSQALTPDSARLTPYGAAVSVSHKALVDQAALDALAGRGVSYLSTRSVGVDHIDLQAAARRGIRVEGVYYSPDSVAEHALMLMLMAARNVGSVLRRAENMDFRLEERRGRELRDMRVGIVGMGRIGCALARRLQALGCRVSAWDRHPAPGVEMAALDKLLARSDLISLHLPLTEGTWHIMDRGRIAAMKQGAILVNTARGDLVDAQALADALEEGRLGGAALDVVEGEQGWFYRDCAGQTPPFARLMALPGVILTPHTAFYTERALRDAVKSTLRNCIDNQGGFKEWIG